MTNSLVSEVEAFLYREAALLDDWMLEDWLHLFDITATYKVPNPGNDANARPSEVVFFIADDYERLRGRVKRLASKNAHIEYPHSKTLHNISNVRVTSEDDDMIHVQNNFVVYRTKNDMTDIFFGRGYYKLKRVDDGFRIIEKVSNLSFDALRPQRMISIII